MIEPAAPSPASELEAAVDEAIAACGGDARDTVRALIVANRFLEDEAKILRVSVSPGYMRRNLKPGQERA